jgi:hypothetical protein
MAKKAIIKKTNITTKQNMAKISIDGNSKISIKIPFKNPIIIRTKKYPPIRKYQKAFHKGLSPLHMLFIVFFIFPFSQT